MHWPGLNPGPVHVKYVVTTVARTDFSPSSAVFVSYTHTNAPYSYLIYLLLTRHNLIN